MSTQNKPIYHHLPYTEEEHRFIMESYSSGDFTYEDIAKALKRKASAIKEHIGRFKIRRHVWTDEMDLFLYVHSKTKSFGNIAIRLGLSKNQVIYRYHSKGYKRFLEKKGLEYKLKKQNNEKDSLSPSSIHELACKQI